MTRSPIFTILALAFLAVPALACGNGECDPPPPPLPPEAEQPVPTPDADRDPVAPTPIIHYGFCCQTGGKMRVSTAWLRDPVKALEQCRAREERLQSLPECPRRIRDQKGGE